VTSTGRRPLVWIDTETTSLRHDRRAWEIAVIVRRDGHPDHEQTWLVDANDLDLGNADPQALAVGRYYDRHPQAGRSADRYVLPPPELNALIQVEEVTRGAVLLGSNPGFDTEVLGARMRANGICPSWHYHPIDVPTLALGVLLGRGEPVPYREDGTVGSDDLCRAFGLDLAGYERHTALGDCRLFRDLYDAATREVAT
jgi:DNA polymerase III epsilon subunit-like protein